MDTGDRSKKNLTKGGARPKENSRKCVNFRSKRIFRNVDTDSDSSPVDKVPLKSVSSLHSRIANYVGLEGYKQLYKNNRKKRKRALFKHDQASSPSPQHWYDVYGRNIFKSNNEFGHIACPTNVSSTKTDSKDTSSEDCSLEIYKSNFLWNDSDDKKSNGELFPAKTRLPNNTVRLLEHGTNNYRDEPVAGEDRCLKTFENSCWTDCSSSDRSYITPQIFSNSGRRKSAISTRNPYNSSDYADLDEENALPDDLKLRRNSTSNENSKYSFPISEHLSCKESGVNESDKKGKSKKSGRKRKKLLGSPQVSRPHCRTSYTKQLLDCDNELTSSSSDLDVTKFEMFSDSDTFETQRMQWDFDTINHKSATRDVKKPFKNHVRFSSSSLSEADDEFECDCNFCFHNPNNSHPSQVELVRSVLNDRTETNEQTFGEWFDVPHLSPTEAAWDAIVQELVEEMRRFNVDVDLFNPSSAMTSSDFEAIPTILPSRLQGQQNQTCPVCLSNYEEDDIAKVLPCSHVFHLQCIKLWLAKSSTCPVCRDVVGKKSLPS